MTRAFAAIHHRIVAALVLQTGGALAAGPTYTITDLGPIDAEGLHATSTADAINNLGQVAGRSTNVEGVAESTLWLPVPDYGMAAGTNGLGEPGRAYGINDHGQVVGFAGPDAYVWDPVEGLTTLGVLGGTDAIARAINGAGWIVGESDTDDPSVLYHAFLYRDGEMIDLGTLDGLNSRAYDINEHGQIVGYSAVGYDLDTATLRPFLWLPEPAYGLPAGLNDIDSWSDETGLYSTARGLNDLGQVGLWGTTQIGISPVAYVAFWLWLPEPDYGLPAGLTNLRGPGGMESTAFFQDINSRGEAVFRANVDPTNPFGDWRAMVWRQGEWFDLHECIPAADQNEWWFGSATDINESGQITGWGGHLGEYRSFRLTPELQASSCDADLSGDGSVGMDDLVAVILSWGPCDSGGGFGGGGGGDCPGDLNGDSAVDTGDIMAVLDGWGACAGIESGACCFTLTGDCQELSDAECAFMGGSWQPGGCAVAACPQPATGGCCLYPSGECVETTAFLCDYSLGGTWGEAGSQCVGLYCETPAMGDRIEDPFVVPSIPFATTGNTAGFRNEYDEQCNGFAEAPDVVYAWTPTEDDTVRISLCDNTSYDSKLFVYENDEDNAVACNDDWCTTPSYEDFPYVSRIDMLEVTAGNTYYIIVDGWGLEAGFYTLDIDQVAIGACCLPTDTCETMTEETCMSSAGLWHGPGSGCDTTTCQPFPSGACCLSNNCIDQVNEWTCLEVFGGTWQGEGVSCQDAVCTLLPGDRIDVALSVDGLPFAATGDTSGFEDWHDESCPYGSEAPEVVYAYTPDTDVTVTISLCADSAFDTKLYVYENVETPGAPFACDDDTCTTPSFPNFPFVSELPGLGLGAGNTYYIVVDGFSDETGLYTLDITED